MAFESFKGFSENQIEQPRGTDVGFTDYLIDVPVGAVKGLSQAVQGLLSLGAMPIDYLANTDLLNGINEIFDKITPDTKTAVGDITSVVAQFGIPFGAAVKIAGGITKLKGIDFAVSTPGKLGTISDLTGLTEQTDFEGLTGKDRAVEELKGKLKFGAEGAIIGGAVPLLPTAASLGFRYGIVPGAKVVGTVGGRTLEYVVDKPLTFAINRIVGSKEKSILQQSLIKSGSLIQKGAEKVGLAGDWRHRPVEGGAVSYVKRQLTRLADQFKSARGLTGELKSVQDSAVTKIAGQEKTLKAIGGRIEDAQRALIKNFKVKFDNGESILKLQIENNKVKDYILASGQTADDILATIPKDIHKDVKAFKDIIVKTNNKYKIFGADLKQMAMLDYDSFSKQRFGAFNNKKFRFNPLLENKAFDFFKAQIRKNPEMMTAITNAAAKSKTSVDVILNQQTKDKLLNFKNTVIQDNANPESLFKQVAKASDIDPKDVLTGHKAVAAAKESEIKSNRAIEVTYNAKEVPVVDETIRDEIANLKAIESQREKIQERTIRYARAFKAKEAAKLAWEVFELPKDKPEAPDTEHLKNLYKEAQNVQGQINSLRKSIRELESGVGKCSACGQELPDSESKQEHLLCLKKELNELVEYQQGKQREHEEGNRKASEYSKHQLLVEKQADLKTAFENAQEALENTEKPDALPDSVEDEITRLTAEYNRQTVAKQQAEQHNTLRAKQIAKYEAQKELVAQAKEKLKSTQESIREYEAYLEDVKILESAFGPKGLVQYKIESNIKVFEALINEYLVLLSNGDFNIRFQIEDSKLRIVVFQHGEEIDINSASSGEFNNINTATLLAVRKMMTSISKVSINILFLDEVISVLDVESRENLIDILVKEQNLNSVVVSHGFEHPLADTVSIVKEGKTSKCK